MLKGKFEFGEQNKNLKDYFKYKSKKNSFSKPADKKDEYKGDDQFDEEVDNIKDEDF